MSVYIKQIKIKNFRSIEHLELTFNPRMNIFVGLNDAGKSNILKALNLFFNGDTDYRRKFNFDTDFCNFAKVRAKTAKEISISILVHADGFKKSEMWFTRKWRKDSPSQPPLIFKKERLCRIPAALETMRFHYIPAIKGVEIFKTLLSQLYSAIPKKENHTLIASAKKFSNAIENYTKTLTKNIKTGLNIDSVINIPDDMQKMFEALTFNTNINDHEIDLDFRGDGIKARHIPPLLKFISDSQKEADHKGKVNTNIIWAYEEPENGVEMLKCFDMAREFISYSANFQIFVTTHSPAFYSVAKEPDIILNKTAEVFYARKSGNATSIFLGDDGLNEAMGLMPLVAPYIKEKQLELEQAKKELYKYKNKKIVFVSGPTDEKYLKHANLVFRILTNDIEIKSINQRGGDDLLKTCMKAEPFISQTNNAFVYVFDCDAQIDGNKPNVVHIAKNLDAPVYKIGIENLLDLPEDFNYAQYYELVNINDRYGEQRQELKKMHLCNHIVSLDVEEKKRVFRFFHPVLEQIKTKLEALQ